MRFPAAWGGLRTDVQDLPFGFDHGFLVLAAPAAVFLDARDGVAVVDHVALAHQVDAGVVQQPRDPVRVEPPEMTLEIGHPEDAQTAGVHEELVVTVADPEEPHVEEAVVGVALALDLQPSAGFEEGIGGAGV